MFRVTNISGGMLVCTLADGKTTLRLKDGKHEDIEDGLMTKHLRNIEKKKLVTVEDLSTTPVAAGAAETEKEA